MKKIISGALCASLVLISASPAFSATKKRKKVRQAASQQKVQQTDNSLATTAVVAAPAASWPDKFEAGWKRGLTFKSKDGNYSLKIKNRLQARYEGEINDSADDKNTFRIRRLKTSFEGNVFSKNLDYKLQLSWINSNLQDVVEDAYLDYKFNPAIRLRTGQFKIPYNRQQMTSSGSQQFVDRSLASDEFRFSTVDSTSRTTCTLPGGGTVTGSGISCGGGATSASTTTNTVRKYHYDIGLMLHGEFLDKKLEYAVAVSNGNGTNRVNSNNDFLYTGRLSWNVMGDYGYSESDLNDSEHPSLAVGLLSGYNVRDIDETKFLQLGTDIGFKYRGFSLQGEYFLRNNNPTGAANSTKDHGYYAQAGYFIVPKKFEIAARASQILFSGANNNRSEYTASANYFMLGHHDLKLQAEYSYLPRQSAAGTLNDHRARVQLQAAF